MLRFGESHWVAAWQNSSGRSPLTHTRSNDLFNNINHLKYNECEIEDIIAQLHHTGNHRFAWLKQSKLFCVCVCERDREWEKQTEGAMMILRDGCMNGVVTVNRWRLWWIALLNLSVMQDSWSECKKCSRARPQHSLILSCITAGLQKWKAECHVTKTPHLYTKTPAS